jgi:hypothetical protein
VLALRGVRGIAAHRLGSALVLVGCGDRVGGDRVRRRLGARRLRTRLLAARIMIS